MDPASFPSWGYALQDSQGIQNSSSSPFSKFWLTSASCRTRSARRSALPPPLPALSSARSHPSHPGGCWCRRWTPQGAVLQLHWFNSYLLPPSPTAANIRSHQLHSRVNRPPLSPHVPASSCSHQQYVSHTGKPGGYLPGINKYGSETVQMESSYFICGIVWGCSSIRYTRDPLLLGSFCCALFKNPLITF